MENWTLTVGCPPEEFEERQKEWLRYRILLRAIKTMPEAIEEISKNNYHLCSICVKAHEYLPYIKLIREIKSIPVLVVSDVYNPKEKVEAIELGADNYIQRPETLAECIATGWALIRRYTELNHKKQEHINIITNKDIFMCLDFRKVFVRSTEVHLTRIEFDILHLMMSNKKRIFTYEQIFCNVWGDDYFDNANSVLWNHIKRLRQKLIIEPDMPNYIKNVHDLGYVFDPE